MTPAEHSLLVKKNAAAWLDTQISACEAQIAQLEADLQNARRNRRRVSCSAPAAPAATATRHQAGPSESDVSVGAIEEMLHKLSPSDLHAVQRRVLALQREELRQQQLRAPPVEPDAALEDAPAATLRPLPTGESSLGPRPETAASSDKPLSARSGWSRRERPTAAAPPVARRFSSRSDKVVRQLDLVGIQLGKLQVLAEQAIRLLDMAEEGVAPLPLEVRNTLAQLHGDCNRLISVGGRMASGPGDQGAPSLTALDAFDTSELVSAQNAARNTRRQLVHKAEVLSSTLAAQIQRFDRLKATVHAT